MYTNEIKNPNFTETNGDPILDDILNGIEDSGTVASIPEWWVNGSVRVEGTTSPDAISYNAIKYVSISAGSVADNKIIIGQKIENIPPVNYSISLLLASRSNDTNVNSYRIYIDDKEISSGVVPFINDNENPLLVDITSHFITSKNPTLNIIFDNYNTNNSPLIAMVNMNNQGVSDRPLGYSYIPIDSYIASEKAKMVGSNDDSMYVLQVNDPNVEDPKRYKTRDICRGVMCGGIFESGDFNILDQYNTDETDIVYGPLGNFKAAIQCGDLGISIKPKTECGVSYKVADGFVEEQLSIMLHDKDTMANSNYPNFIDLSDEENLYAVLTGLKFNFLTKQPLNLNYYDFDKGHMWGNSFKLKNPYNLEWGVDTSISEDLNTATTENHRTYNKIGLSDDIAWLSYNVNDSFSGSKVDYFNVTRDEYKVGYDPKCFRSIDLEGDPQGPLTEDPMVYQMEQDTLYSDHYVPINERPNTEDYMRYEHVERIQQSSRRTITERSHKSNIYSIRISGSGLNENITDLEVRKTIQDSINTTIREMVKSAAPADTQLWQIIWDGE